MFQLLISAIQTNHMGAIAHDLNPVLTPSCLKKIAGINTINAWTLNTLTMICFYGYKHNFMLVL